MQLDFNLSNRVTNPLESSAILIYLIQVKGIYTHKVTLFKNKKLIKRITKENIIAS